MKSWPVSGSDCEGCPISHRLWGVVGAGSISLLAVANALKDWEDFSADHDNTQDLRDDFCLFFETVMVRGESKIKVRGT